MTDPTNSGANRAQRRQAGRARRIGAAGSGAILATSAAAFLATMGAGPAGAAPITITVSNTNDSGAGSLREALANASDEDTIDLTGLSGTITLSSQLVIEDAVTITGPGAGVLTISGNDSTRVFETIFANPGGTGTVTISGLTIADGNSTGQGAAITFECDGGSESLVVEGVHFTGNTSAWLGGALYFDRCDDAGGGVKGDLVITGSRFEDNQSTALGSGAVWSDEGGATVVDTTTFVGNHAAVFNGGALYVDRGDSVTITNSTFVENSTARTGGAFRADTIAGDVLIANSTFTANTAATNGGAIVVSGAETFELLQSTITGNTADGVGDGLYLVMYEVQAGAVPDGSAGPQADSVTDEVAAAVIRDSATITGSIVAGNADGTDDINGSGTAPVTLTSNVIGVVADTLNVVDGGGNQLGITDPKLAPLSNNGGPTATMGLAPGSPALDAGPATVPTFPGNEFDQRGPGFARVVNGKVDVGAFEVQPEAPAPIDIAPRFTG